MVLKVYCRFQRIGELNHGLGRQGSEKRRKGMTDQLPKKKQNLQGFCFLSRERSSDKRLISSHSRRRRIFGDQSSELVTIFLLYQRYPPARVEIKHPTPPPEPVLEPPPSVPSEPPEAVQSPTEAFSILRQISLENWLSFPDLS
jgi:hypothetical protein